MRHPTMSDKEALNRIHPRSRAARKQLLAIFGFVALAVAAVVGLTYAKYKTQQYREENWDSAIATIEDVRTSLVSANSSQFGGRMLYDIQVLAKFSVDGAPQERWIKVDQMPENLDMAQFHERLWNGKRYVVRWKPSNLDRIVVEIH